MQRVAFELMNQRGEPLRGDLLTPDAAYSRPVVVVCHGFKGFKNWGFFPELGTRLAEAGFVGVLFNFSGSGIGPDLQNFTELERFADDTISRQVDDLGVILDALSVGKLAASAADPRRIGVLGHSRGGATALIRAHEDRRIRALVTWSAVSRLLRYSERELAEWKRLGYAEFLNTRTRQTMRIHYTMVEDLMQNAERLDPLKAIREISVPVLIVHGEEDLSVRVQEGRDLYAAAHSERCELQIVPRTGHTFGAVHPWQGTTPALETAIGHSLRWFGEHLGGPGPEGRGLEDDQAEESSR